MREQPTYQDRNKKQASPNGFVQPKVGRNRRIGESLARSSYPKKVAEEVKVELQGANNAADQVFRLLKAPEAQEQPVFQRVILKIEKSAVH